MEQMNFHKQKLYALILAGIAFISLFLPWVSMGMFGSVNGFRSWGLLSFLGVIGVVVSCFIGNKTVPFDDTFKKVAMGSFAGISIGALIYYFNLGSGFIRLDSGFGLWLCLIIGVLGLLWVIGLVKLPDNKKPPTV